MVWLWIAIIAPFVVMVLCIARQSGYIQGRIDEKIEMIERLKLARRGEGGDL